MRSLPTVPAPQTLLPVTTTTAIHTHATHACTCALHARTALCGAAQCSALQLMTALAPPVTSRGPACAPSALARVCTRAPAAAVQLRLRLAVVPSSWARRHPWEAGEGWAWPRARRASARVGHVVVGCRERGIGSDVNNARPQDMLGQQARRAGASHEGFSQQWLYVQRCKHMQFARPVTTGLTCKAATRWCSSGRARVPYRRQQGGIKQAFNGLHTAGLCVPTIRVAARRTPDACMPPARLPPCPHAAPIACAPPPPTSTTLLACLPKNSNPPRRCTGMHITLEAPSNPTFGCQES